MLNKQLIHCTLLSLFILLSCKAVVAGTVSPPQDPTQSITYWKPYAINPQQDRAVKLAHTIFKRLLQAWDNTRIPPALHVVKSEGRAWAASLDDGNILLSRDAINITLKSGKRHSEHQLAFVLAHELAHQRTNDLWHRKFFRLAGSLDPESRKHYTRGMHKSETPEQLENKETQADQSALMLMALVGYDPNAVVSDKGLFTQWVESVRGFSCNQTASGDAGGDLSAQESSTVIDIPCAQARSRVERLRIRLQEVANQSVLFELGVQAYVAGQYASARNYFQAFGRDFPGRAIHSNIGLTFLSEALALRRRLAEFGVGNKAALPLTFVYPLMLDGDMNFKPRVNRIEQKRRPGANRLGREETDRIYVEMNAKIQDAIKLFERATQIDPDHRYSYILLASAYLLAKNVHMARGLILDKYVPQYRRDIAAELMLATATAIEGNLTAAKQQFQGLLKNDGLFKAVLKGNDFFAQLALFCVYQNYGFILESTGEMQMAKSHWRSLARQTKQSGNAVLFQLARAHLRGEPSGELLSKRIPKLSHIRLGSTLSNPASAVRDNSLWMEGERLHLYRESDGLHYVLKANNEVMAAWQRGGEGHTSNGVYVGDNKDRVLKRYGLPSRVISSLQGQYLAYDAERLAFQITFDEVRGWFIY